jgi:hypothetical protein
MRTRRAKTALAALGSYLLASLVSFRAVAETPSPPSEQAAAPVASGAATDALEDATPFFRARAATVTELEPRSFVTEAAPEPTLPYVADEAPGHSENASATDRARRVVVFHRAPKDTSDPQAAQRRMLGWIAGTIGIAGLGLGATTCVLALKKDPLDRQCADPIRICSPDGKARSGGLTALSAVGWGIGVLGISTGLVLVITNNKRTGRETALGTDFYRGGAGLKVSRTW